MENPPPPVASIPQPQRKPDESLDTMDYEPSSQRHPYKATPAKFVSSKVVEVISSEDEDEDENERNGNGVPGREEEEENEEEEEAEYTRDKKQISEGPMKSTDRKSVV